MNNKHYLLLITILITLSCFFFTINKTPKTVYPKNEIDVLSDTRLKNSVDSLHNTIENVHIEGVSLREEKSENSSFLHDHLYQSNKSLDLQFQTNFFNVDFKPTERTKQNGYIAQRNKPEPLSEENSLQIKVIEEEIDYLNEKLQKFQNILNKINYQ